MDEFPIGYIIDIAKSFKACSNDFKLVGGLEHFLFSHILGF